MKYALILGGPSGAGKSTVASLIAKNHNYKHCDIDEFKWIFSHDRSKERTAIGEYVGYIYAKELIKRKHNVIIEALPEKYIKKLIPLLQKHNNKIIRVCLKAPLEQCLKNNLTRSKKGYSSEVIREVYKKLSNCKGDTIDTSNKSTKQIYDIIKEKYFK